MNWWCLSVWYDEYINVDSCPFFMWKVTLELVVPWVVVVVVDNYDDDMVLTLIWIMTCWLCGCKYLIMQLLVN